MKLNIANPSTGLQKVIEIDDDKKLLPFYDKRMSHEISGDTLGDEFKGYVFRISGGNDKQGFPMKQGVLVNHRVRLLFKKGMSCFRERRNGSRKRKSVRGCIVGPDLAMLNLVVVKKGEGDVPGLTDDQKPRRLGPKRASNIRKLFALSKQDDVRQFVVRREAGKKKKAPKIQRLITPVTLQRRRRLRSLMRNKLEQGKKDRKAYFERVAEFRQEQKAKRAAEVAKKKKEKKKAPAEEEKAAPPAKKGKEEPKKAAAKAQPAGKAVAKGKAAAKQASAAPKAAAGKQPAAKQAAAKQSGKKK